MSKKILVYPETRQTFNYDCGANGQCQCWSTPASKSVKSAL